MNVKFFCISPAGMWGSAFAASLDDICLKVVGVGLSFLDSFKDVIKVVGKNIYENCWIFQKIVDFVVITSSMMQKCAACSFQAWQCNLPYTGFGQISFIECYSL